MHMSKKIIFAALVLILSTGLHVQAQTWNTNPAVGSNSTSNPSVGSNPATVLPANSANPAVGSNPTSGNPATGSNPGSANPAVGSDSTQNFYLQNPLSSRFNSVGGIVEGGLEIVSYIAVLFAVLMIIWVGLQFVLAQGKPQRLSELKSWLLWIVIGVAVVIGARIIVSVVINTLEATGTVNQSVINNARSGLGGN